MQVHLPVTRATQMPSAALIKHANAWRKFWNTKDLFSKSMLCGRNRPNFNKKYGSVIGLLPQIGKESLRYRAATG